MENCSEKYVANVCCKKARREPPFSTQFPHQNLNLCPISKESCSNPNKFNKYSFSILGSVRMCVDC